MNTKSKGSNAERELIHAFWKVGFAALRSAGSGSMKYPCPDIIACKDHKRIVIECKITKDQSKYFEKREIDELTLFAEKWKAEAYVAVKFKGKEWIFLKTQDLVEKGKSWVINNDLATKKGRSFTQLITY